MVFLGALVKETRHALDCLRPLCGCGDGSRRDGGDGA